MAVYKFQVQNPKPDLEQGGYVGSIKLYGGSSKNITGVQALLSSGTGTFNLMKAYPANEDFLDFDDTGFDLLWHFRADDITSLSSGADVSTWYSTGDGSVSIASGGSPPSWRSTAGANSKPGVQFDGSEYLEASTGISSLAYDSSLTLFVVTGANIQGNTYAAIVGAASPDSVWRTFWGKYSDSERFYNDNGNNVTNGSSDIYQEQIRSLVCINNNAVAARCYEYVDGEIGAINNDTLSLNSSGGYSFDEFGSTSRVYRGSVTRRYLEGDISELMAFNGDLSTAQREKVEGYLAHKYSLEGSLPSGHTYKSTDPVTPPGTFLINDQALSSTYFTQISVSHSISETQPFYLFMPKAQNPGVLTVAIETD